MDEPASLSLSSERLAALIYHIISWALIRASWNSGNRFGRSGHLKTGTILEAFAEPHALPQYSKYIDECALDIGSESDAASYPRWAC
jgi:hypothetical protein